MRTILLITLFTCTGLICQAQIFIGKNKDEVKEMMKEKREYGLDKSAVNTEYNTLKYVDNRGTRTYLFLFDEKDICTLSKLMCDYSYLNRITKELNESYEAKEEGQWTHSENGNKYLITLDKGDWFFSVRTKKSD